MTSGPFSLATELTTTFRRHGSPIASRIVRRSIGPVATALIAVALIALPSLDPIPNPGLILLLSVAVSAVLGGVAPALVSALIAVVFAMVDASIPGRLFHYSPDAFTRLAVNMGVAPLMAVLVGSIQRRLEVEQQELAQRHSDARQRALTDTATDAIVTIDAASTIVSANASTAEMFGIPLDDLVGGPLQKLMPDALRERHRVAFRRYLATGVRRIPWQGVELTARHVSGREFPVEVSFGEYSSPEGRRFTGIIRDISRRKDLELRLLQTQKMEAIGRLAGGIAHDFNNLLTAISGYAILLSDDLDPADPRQEAIGEIRQASDRATALTRQLLTFSRGRHLQPVVVSLNDVIDRVEPLLRRLLGEDIDLAIRTADGLGSIRTDPAQMETVLMNLAINARDAMTTGGTVTIETSNVTLGEEYAVGHFSVAPGRYVMVAVSDTGEGMDAETLSHVFEPFFTTKQVGQGTGLGLATVYAVVKQSGGNIWAYSEPGHGTTFKVYVPLVDEVPVTLAPPSGGMPIERGTETILVAEDEDAVRELIVGLLARQGYTALSAANGREALDVLRAGDGRVDLLLTDVVMPELSGPQLAEEARAMRPEMPIVYISGYTPQTLTPRGLAEDAILLEKPFTPQRLAEVIRQALDAARVRAG